MTLLYFASTVGLDGGFETKTGIAQPGPTSITLASAPSISDEVQLAVRAPLVVGTVNLALPGMAAAANYIWWETFDNGAGFILGNARLPMASGAGPHLETTIGGGAGTLELTAVGYRMNVRRLG